MEKEQESNLNQRFVFLLPLDIPYQEAWLFPLLEVEFTGQEHLAPGSLLEIQPMEGHPKPTHQF